MKTALINNFVDSSPIEISPMQHERAGGLILLTQRGGAMSFQHAMKPAQAREMAAALVALADSFEVMA